MLTVVQVDGGSLRLRGGHALTCTTSAGDVRSHDLNVIDPFTSRVGISSNSIHPDTYKSTPHVLLSLFHSYLLPCLLFPYPQPLHSVL
jgi:hypothetical protein